MPTYKDTAYLSNHSKQKIETWQCSGTSNLVQKLQAKNLLKNAAKLLMLSGLVVVMYIFLPLLLTLVALLSVAILVLVLSHIELTRLLKKLRAALVLQKNEYLQAVLQEIEMDTEEVWKDIVTNGGSVQHLEFLDEWTKYVFKTAVEIDQRWVVDMAADRQKQICQSQSLNVFFPSDVSKQELHAIHMMAWKKKVKTLYYLRSEAHKRAETVSDEVLRQRIFESMDESACVACEG